MEGLRKAYRSAVIIGLAMIASVLVFAVIVELVKDGDAQIAAPYADAQTTKTLKYLLLAVSALLFPAIRFVNGYFFALSPSPKRGGRVGISPEAQRFITAAVIVFALCELPSIFGLVFFFLTGSQTDFFIFLLISLLFFSLHFPKYSQWEDALRRWKYSGAKGRKP